MNLEAARFLRRLGRTDRGRAGESARDHFLMGHAFSRLLGGRAWDACSEISRRFGRSDVDRFRPGGVYSAACCLGTGHWIGSGGAAW